MAILLKELNWWTHIATVWVSPRRRNGLRAQCLIGWGNNIYEKNQMELPDRKLYVKKRDLGCRFKSVSLVIIKVLWINERKLVKSEKQKWWMSPRRRLGSKLLKHRQRKGLSCRVQKRIAFRKRSSGENGFTWTKHIKKRVVTVSTTAKFSPGKRNGEKGDTHTILKNPPSY